MLRELVKAAGDLGESGYYGFQRERSEKIVVKPHGSEVLSTQPRVLGSKQVLRRKNATSENKILVFQSDEVGWRASPAVIG